LGVRIGLAVLGLLALSLGCAAPARETGSGADRGAQPQAQGTPKRLTVGIMAEPPAFYRGLIPPGHSGQSGDLADVLSGGLTVVDEGGTRHARLAAEIPSLENGLWRLLPDGRMTLTWRIRAGSAWHDGTPLTADDLLFVARLAEDRDLPEFRASGFDTVEAVDAVDAQSVVVTWRRPYIWADRMFSSSSGSFGSPLPRHILEPAYLSNKEGFRQLPYWSAEYIGLGPYRLRELAPGSHVTLEASRSYVLGRPRIDEIEVRFVTDANTLTAGLLANAIDLTLGSSLSLEQALNVRDQWSNGGLAINYSSWIVAFPQFINPNPPVVLDVRFRRALLHAVDRQAMADEIQAGMVPIAHSYVSPSEREYKDTEARAVRYEYDGRRAQQLLEEIGYSRLPDGGWRDARGQRLSLEVRSTGSPAIHGKAFFPLVDYWQRLGLDIDPVVLPVQRLSDLEYRTTMPTFEMIRFPNGAESVWRLHSTQAPLPENRFTGNNRSRYINPEFDALIDGYLTTIPWAERMRVLGDIVYHISDQLIMMGLFYDVKSFMVAKRLVGFTPSDNATWNAQEWDVR
jgi:peptide/nickel transport system substrate-binding protein